MAYRGELAGEECPAKHRVTVAAIRESEDTPGYALLNNLRSSTGRLEKLIQDLGIRLENVRDTTPHEPEAAPSTCDDGMPPYLAELQRVTTRLDQAGDLVQQTINSIRI